MSLNTDVAKKWLPFGLWGYVTPGLIPSILPNNYFQFKQFRIDQNQSALKVCTDACILGAWSANIIAARIQDDSNPGTAIRTLDVGTGTGLLTLMLAQVLSPIAGKSTPKLDFTAIELDQASYQEATENFERSGWASSITALQVDARQYEFPELSGSVDFIVANPPFFQGSLKAGNKARNAALHNDTFSLNDLVEFCNRSAKPETNIFVLLPPAEMDIFLMLLPADYDLLEMLSVRNSGEGPVFRQYAHLIRNPNQQQDLLKPAIRTEQAIKQMGSKHPHQYSDWFADLLGAFYLQL